MFQLISRMLADRVSSDMKQVANSFGFVESLLGAAGGRVRGPLRGDHRLGFPSDQQVTCKIAFVLSVSACSS